MYHPTFEIVVEMHRRDILNEMKHIRLEEEAERSAHLYRPGWFARVMFDFANWMIATGRQIRRRYEVPAVACNPPTRGSFAH